MKNAQIALLPAKRTRRIMRVNGMVVDSVRTRIIGFWEAVKSPWTNFHQLLNTVAGNPVGAETTAKQFRVFLKGLRAILVTP
jgi:hypothetical protein